MFGLFAPVYVKGASRSRLSSFLGIYRQRRTLQILKNGGDRILLKVPLFKGNLGGSGLSYKREIKRFSGNF